LQVHGRNRQSHPQSIQNNSHVARTEIDFPQIEAGKV
jgi:hypothetical protein